MANPNPNSNPNPNPNPAPTPQNIVKKHRPGGLLTDLILFLLDTALTLFLFVTPFCLGGAYGNFVLPEFAFGVIYVIIRVILGRVEHTKKIDVFYILLRIAGVTVAAIYYVVLFQFGNWFDWFYPVRKYLYINGNFSDAAYFDFLPDSIPGNTTKYHMVFEPPVNAMAPSIDISFYTDAAGIAEFRGTAVSKGGRLCGNDDPVFSETAGRCQQKGLEDIQKAEVYAFDGFENIGPSYVINENTGFCMVRWKA